MPGELGADADLAADPQPHDAGGEHARRDRAPLRAGEDALLPGLRAAEEHAPGEPGAAGDAERDQRARYDDACLHLLLLVHQFHRRVRAALAR